MPQPEEIDVTYTCERCQRTFRAVGSPLDVTDSVARVADRHDSRHPPLTRQPLRAVPPPRARRAPV